MKNVFLSVSILILFPILLITPTNSQAFTTVADCAHSPSPGSCVEVWDCRSIDTSGRYYLLMDNVVSQGTCFYLEANNVVFDLNGKTITYAQSRTGHAFYDGSYSSEVIIRNGSIVGDRDLGETNSYSHAISFPGSGSDLEIYDLEISVAGVQTQGMFIDEGDGLSIHDVIIDMESRKLGDHASDHLPGIGVSQRGGSIEIYNNRITGDGMLGISTTRCGNWNVDIDGPMLIHDNYISMWSPVRDGYAIMIASNDGSCSDGTKIFNNTIEQINGRGIIVDGWERDSPGPGNVEIYSNYIDVREGRDFEYPNDLGMAAGIRVRFGANNIHAYDNFITGEAGYGVAVGSDASKDGSRIAGLYLGSRSPRGVNNRYTNNYIDVSTNSPDCEAMAVYVAGGNPGSESVPSYFEGNTFKSNNHPIRVSYDDGGGYNAHFESTTIIKGDNPQDYNSIALGFWISGAKNISFKDTVGQNGASVYDMRFYPCNGGCTAEFDDINISWTLNVKAEDSNGYALPNALVQVTDNYGNTSFSGMSDSSGLVSGEVIERSYSGSDQGIEEIYSPFTISVDYNGEILSRVVNITHSSTETFVFGGAAYTCGDVDGDGIIAHEDIEFLVNYMFYGGPAPDPLLIADMDLNGGIDISDIIYLVDYLYQGGASPCDTPGISAKNYDDWTEQDVLEYIDEARNSGGLEVSGGCGITKSSKNSKISVLVLALIAMSFLLFRRKRLKANC